MPMALRISLAQLFTSMGFTMWQKHHSSHLVCLAGCRALSSKRVVTLLQARTGTCTISAVI